MSSAASTVSLSVAVPRIVCARRRVFGSNQSSLRTLPFLVGRCSGVLLTETGIRVQILLRAYPLQVASGPAVQRTPREAVVVAPAPPGHECQGYEQRGMNPA